MRDKFMDSWKDSKTALDKVVGMVKNKDKLTDAKKAQNQLSEDQKIIGNRPIGKKIEKVNSDSSLSITDLVQNIVNGPEILRAEGYQFEE